MGQSVLGSTLGKPHVVKPNAVANAESRNRGRHRGIIQDLYRLFRHKHKPPSASGPRCGRMLVGARTRFGRAVAFDCLPPVLWQADTHQRESLDLAADWR